MNLNPLGNALDQFVYQQRYSNKKTNHFFHRMQDLANRLKTSTEDISLREALPDGQEIEKKINDIKDFFFTYEKHFEDQAKSKNTRLEKTKKIGQECLAKIEYFKNSDFNLSDVNYNLNKTKDSFCSWERTLNKMFDKCEKLKIKLNEDKKDQDSITKSFMLRLKNLISFRDLSHPVGPSDNKKSHYIEKYRNLKSVWIASYVAYRSLKADVDNKTISVKIKNAMGDFESKIQKLGEYFDNLNVFFKTCDIFSLDSRFKEKYASETTPKNYKRDFSSFFQDALNYAAYKELLEEKGKILDQLENSKSEFKLNVDGCLSEISQIIESMKKESQFANLDFNNGEISFESSQKNSLLFSIVEKQSEEISTIDEENIKDFDKKADGTLQDCLTQTMKSLTSLHEEITTQWYTHCLNIEKIKFQKELFEKFKEINENFSLCYFLAEDLHGNLRKLRKTENSKDIHITKCKENYDDNEILNILIFGLHPLKEKKISSEQYNKLLTCLKKESNFNLSAQYQNVMALTESMINFSLPEVPYNSENHQVKMKKLLDEYKKTCVEELEKCQKHVSLAFSEKLPKICGIVAKSFNIELEALRNYGKDPAYNDCFIKAFSAEHPVGRFVQESGSYITSGISNALAYSGSFIGFGKNEQTIPNEELLDALLKLKDVVSLFEISLKDSIIK